MWARCSRQLRATELFANAASLGNASNPIVISGGPQGSGQLFSGQHCDRRDAPDFAFRHRVSGKQRRKLRRDPHAQCHFQSDHADRQCADRQPIEQRDAGRRHHGEFRAVAGGRWGEFPGAVECEQQLDGRHTAGSWHDAHGCDQCAAAEHDRDVRNDLRTRGARRTTEHRQPDARSLRFCHDHRRGAACAEYQRQFAIQRNRDHHQQRRRGGADGEQHDQYHVPWSDHQWHRCTFEQDRRWHVCGSGIRITTIPATRRLLGRHCSCYLEAPVALRRILSCQLAACWMSRFSAADTQSMARRMLLTTAARSPAPSTSTARSWSRQRCGG